MSRITPAGTVKQLDPTSGLGHCWQAVWASFKKKTGSGGGG
jgi:hypothetical protein